MNKKIKRVVAVLLAFTLVLSMGITSLAATKKATVYYIDYVNSRAFLQDLTAEAVYNCWYGYFEDSDEYLMILVYKGIDGNPYFGYYYLDAKTNKSAEYLCGQVDDCYTLNEKTGVKTFVGMYDVFSCQDLNDFTITPIQNDPTRENVVFGETNVNLCIKTGEEAVECLAALLSIASECS